MPTSHSLEDEIARRIEFLKERSCEADRSIERLRRLALTGEVLGQGSRSGDFSAAEDLVQLKRDLVAAEQKARADYVKVTGRAYEADTGRKEAPSRTDRQTASMVSEEQAKKLRKQYSQPTATLNLQPGGATQAQRDRVTRERDRQLAAQIAAIEARLAEHHGVARDAFGRAQGMG